MFGLYGVGPGRPVPTAEPAADLYSGGDFPFPSAAGVELTLHFANWRLRREIGCYRGATIGDSAKISGPTKCCIGGLQAASRLAITHFC